MPVTLYLRILVDQWKEYEQKGWKFVREVYPIGGWRQFLVRKEVTE